MTAATTRVAPGPATVISPAPAHLWREVLAAAPPALPSQTPEWLRCVCEVGGYEDVSRLYLTADGRRLVLPLVRRRIGGIAVKEAALPQGWEPAGLIAEGGVRPDDVRLIADDLARSRALTVEVRPRPTEADIWESAVPPGVRRKPQMAQTVFLAEDFDTMWRSRFRKDARHRCRRAERHGVVVERDDSGQLLARFHELYAESVDRWARREGVPLWLARRRAARREPPRKLRAVAATAGTGLRMYGAYVDGELAAAMAAMIVPPIAVTWRGAMREKLAGPVFANYLLEKTIIQDAIEAGCTVYNMGESAPGSGLALFKSRFGAVEQHYNCYVFERIPVSAADARARAVARWLFALRTGRS